MYTFNPNDPNMFVRYTVDNFQKVWADACSLESGLPELFKVVYKTKAVSHNISLRTVGTQHQVLHEVEALRAFVLVCSILGTEEVARLVKKNRHAVAETVVAIAASVPMLRNYGVPNAYLECIGIILEHWVVVTKPSDIAQGLKITTDYLNRERGDDESFLPSQFPFINNSLIAIH